MAEQTVTNTAKGPRGLNTVNGYRELAPGETASVELTEAEAKSAKGVGYFAFGKAAAEKAAESANDDLDVTVAKLREIAVAEKVDLNGATAKADIQDAIRTARADKAASTSGQANDDLDNMSDDDLRTTVQAVTGSEPAADASREQLLKLARGQE